ncbi:trypsin-like peptidase domain-containing protein [Luedemannella helvata]|uniref:Serine protease n=1 Tax=Luedemannella helvata TaxID=349315 RepID=A0ABP4VZZ5_9ACTN
MSIDSRVPNYLGRVLDSDGAPVGTCFQVSPGVLVTAWHVLAALGAGGPGDVVAVDALAGGIAASDARVLRVAPPSDLAVLVADAPLPGMVVGLAATDEVPLLAGVVVAGVVQVDDGERQYRWLAATGRWKSGTTRDETVSLGRFTSKDVLPGMSGGPVRRLTDDAVVGVVSGRYNAADDWLSGTVWVARVEELLPLLDGLVRPVMYTRQDDTKRLDAIPRVGLEPAGDHPSVVGAWPAAKRQLFRRVRAQESQDRAYLLGLDIKRSVAAEVDYAVEHTARFREKGAAGPAVRTDIQGFFTGPAKRQLVVLGSAGAGKSVLLTGLILGLLGRLSADDPVPVRFQLVGWDPSADLGDWLVSELGSRYGIAAAAARGLLFDRAVLPVLDGLDEISAEREDLDAAVRAVNAFVADHGQTGYVVTCRSSVYSDLGRDIEPASEITILPLTAEEIVRYVDDAIGGRTVNRMAWQMVLDAVQAGHSDVIDALSTPWQLTLAVTYFRDNNDMRRLIPEGTEDGVQYRRRVRDLLVGTFAPARARLHAIAASDTADAWCRVIAEDLEAQVARGGPRQDIMTHYSAERAWASELIHRALTVTVAYLKVWFGLGVLTLGAWLVDVVAGTAIVRAVQSALHNVANSPTAVLAAALAGLAILAAVGYGVPRASRMTRRSLRMPGLPAWARSIQALKSGIVLVSGVLLGGLLQMCFVALVIFVIVWPVTGAGQALRLALIAGLVVALPTGVAAGLQSSTKRRFEVWYGQLVQRATEQRSISAHAEGISANWTVPSPDLDQAVGTARTRRNWPAAVEAFLTDGYTAGIFRRSGEVYQFRHRQLLDWYSRPVHPLRAWDNELPLPRVVDAHLVHQVNLVYYAEGRAAAQRLVFNGRDQGARNERLRAVAAEAGARLRPPSVLARCDIHLLRALSTAEDEARANGSALIQPWHLLVALFVGIRRHCPECPADPARIRTALRPARTITLDDSPGHVPLARATRRAFIAAAGRRHSRIRPEFLVWELLNGGDDATHDMTLALRHPVDIESDVRTWLDDRIAQLDTGDLADSAMPLAELAELAEVLRTKLGRPDEAERLLQQTQTA